MDINPIESIQKLFQDLTISFGGEINEIRKKKLLKFDNNIVMIQLNCYFLVTLYNLILVWKCSEFSMTFEKETKSLFNQKLSINAADYKNKIKVK